MRGSPSEAPGARADNVSRLPGISRKGFLGAALFFAGFRIYDFVWAVRVLGFRVLGLGLGFGFGVLVLKL